LMRDVCSLIWLALIGLFRSRASLQVEILTLRHQLNVLRRKSPQRLGFTSIDRLVFAGLYRLAPGVLDALRIVRAFALNADRQDVRACGPRSEVRVDEALALADNTRCAVVDQVPTMRFVAPSFQIRSGPNFEIPVGLFRPAPSFSAALEPRQKNQRARELTRV
jgi:hypothetical protein